MSKVICVCFFYFVIGWQNLHNFLSQSEAVVSCTCTLSCTWHWLHIITLNSDRFTESTVYLVIHHSGKIYCFDFGFTTLKSKLLYVPIWLFLNVFWETFYTYLSLNIFRIFQELKPFSSTFQSWKSLTKVQLFPQHFQESCTNPALLPSRRDIRESKLIPDGFPVVENIWFTQPGGQNVLKFRLFYSWKTEMPVAGR